MEPAIYILLKETEQIFDLYWNCASFMLYFIVPVNEEYMIFIFVLRKDGEYG